MTLPRRSAVALLVLVLAGAMLLGCGCTTRQPAAVASANDSIATMTFYSEQHPPYNYGENGTVKGISIDLFEAITAKMGQNVSRDRIRLVPWDEAYRAALTGNNTMIFAIARIPARETSFKWAGPLPPYVTAVFARSDSGVVIDRPEDLRRYRIGAVADDVAVQQLLDIGVNGSRLVQVPNASALVDLAQKGGIDLWADSMVAGRSAARQATGTTSTFRVVYTFPEIPIYYGFSRDVPNATVQAFQQALDALKTRDAGGVTAYDRIVQRYVPQRSSG